MLGIKNDKSEADLELQIFQNGTPVTSGNSFQPFVNVSKNYIKDFVWFLDPPF